MLINFEIENWTSFRDSTSLNMIASREKHHSERVALTTPYNVKILPVAAIYGGNASGKSNFWKAIRFVKMMVTRRLRNKAPIQIQPFLLNEINVDSPVKFITELLVSEKIYRLSFAVNKHRVIEESLELAVSESRRKLLYRRCDGAPIHYDASIESDFLHFVEQGTLPNQLFLNNAISQNDKTFAEVYEWFDDSLELISPESGFFGHSSLQENHPNFAIVNEVLASLDTGIRTLAFEKVDIESLKMPKELLEQIHGEVSVKGSSVWFPYSQGESVALSRENGELTVKRLSTFHSNDKGLPVKFGMTLESQGTKRVINLLPSFLELCALGSNKVLIVDEIDSSLHTILTRQLLYGFLSTCSPQSRSQLVFTTHDIMMMDQEFLRRDEMWVAERTFEGNSSLTSFSDFKEVRKDKDVRKSYLQGRLGGIPKVFLQGTILQSWKSKSDSRE